MNLIRQGNWAPVLSDVPKGIPAPTVDVEVWYAMILPQIGDCYVVARAGATNVEFYWLKSGVQTLDTSQTMTVRGFKAFVAALTAAAEADAA